MADKTKFNMEEYINLKNKLIELNKKDRQEKEKLQVKEIDNKTDEIKSKPQDSKKNNLIINNSEEQEEEDQTNDLEKLLHSETDILELDKIGNDINSTLNILESSINEHLSKTGIKYTFDLKVKGVISNLKNLHYKYRKSTEKRIYDLENSDLNRQLIEIKKLHNEELKELRQREADIIRKLKTNHIKQLDKEITATKAMVLEQLQKQYEKEKSDWMIATRNKMETDYAKLADSRANVIEQKLLKLEKEYVSSVKVQLNKTNSAFSKAEILENQANEVDRQKRDLMNQMEQLKIENTKRLEDVSKQLTLQLDEVLKAKRLKEIELNELNNKYDYVLRKLDEEQELNKNSTTKIEDLTQMLATEKAYAIEKRDRELADIETRVKNIIAKKDAHISLLQKQVNEATRELEAAQIFLEFTKAAVGQD